MATTKGIDIRSSGGTLVFRVSLKDSAGAKLTSGTTTMQLLELQDNGTFKTYDFSDNTFKTTAPTTATLALTHRTSNNATTNTGIWTAILATLTGLTVGAVYIAQVSNTGAFPADQEREFQYGAVQGDLTVDSNGKVLLQAAQPGVNIPTVTNVGTVATLTGHTAQTGDAFGRIGANGAGLTSLGDTRLTNLDAAISSRNAVAPPSASTNASAVRTELAPELGRLDVAVSSRNSTTPPTAAANASAVRANLTAELANLDAPISGVRTVVDGLATGQGAASDLLAKLLMHAAGAYTFTEPTTYPGTGTLVFDDEPEVTYEIGLSAKGAPLSRAIAE